MPDRRPLPRPTARCLRVIAAALLVALMSHAANAQQQKFKETRSRSQYAHHIQLYDARGIQIDPTAEDARPYSPNQTCKKCHDYKAIEHGYHFNAADLAVFGETTDEGKPKPLDHGRKGEPWLWTDEATGTQIPLSYRPWPGVYDPADVGLTPFAYTKEFGRHKPGGGVGERKPYTGETIDEGASSADAASASSNGGADSDANASDTTETSPAPDVDPDAAKWKSRGHLEIDCMICHSADRAYSHEKYIKEIEKENFAWAPTVAMGIGKSEGYASSLPDTYDPENLPEGEASKLPKTKYDPTRFDSEGFIFMDIVRTPPNHACYMCHTARPVGEEAHAKWLHDEDVHLRAGMQCADCHRNGLDHHTVRGYEGETHPTGAKIETLSCRGCHYDESADPTGPSQTGGRLGAPRPLHKGIPPIHFDTMSCTSCHSGPLPEDAAQRLQTSMAHALGKAVQDKTDADLPGIVQPVFLYNDDDVLYPHRMVWPAFWGWMDGDAITPIGPSDAWLTLRRPPLRIRRGTPLREQLADAKLTAEERAEALGGEEEAAKPDEELTDKQRDTLAAKLKEKQAKQFKEGLGKGLAMFAANPPSEGAVPVYVAGGKVWRIEEGAEIPGTSALRTESPPVVSFEHDAAKPYAWALGHDVRPARKSLGVTGCIECHADGAEMFYGQVAAVSPAIEESPKKVTMFELLKLDETELDAWEQSFTGRPLFKWVGFVAIGAVALIVVLALLLGLNGLLKLIAPRK